MHKPVHIVKMHESTAAAAAGRVGNSLRNSCRLLAEEKARGVPIACMIESLDLAESRATLLLQDADDASSSSSSDSDEGSDGGSAARDAGSPRSGGAGGEDAAAAATSDAGGGSAGGGECGRGGDDGSGGDGDAQRELRGQGGTRSRRRRPQRVAVDLTENAFGNAKQVRCCRLLAPGIARLCLVGCVSVVFPGACTPE